MLSFSTCRALAPWQGLLLAVSLLNVSCLTIKPYFGVHSTSATEGDDVLLRIGNYTIKAGTLIWYRGPLVEIDPIIAVLKVESNTQLGYPVCGRVTINYDGSLLLKNVTKDDAGVYAIVNYHPFSEKEIGFRRLRVYEPVGVPTLTASSTIVTENKDTVVFTCYTNAGYTQWFFNGMNLQLTERMTLSEDHRILTINPVKRKDAGYYQCEGSNIISFVKSLPLELHVNLD